MGNVTGSWNRGADPASPGPGLAARLRAVDVPTLAKVAFALLCLACAIGIVVYPTYPNYDSYYSLLWGQEALHGTLPHFQGFRVPTEHPLAIVAGALLACSAGARTGCGSR